MSRDRSTGTLVTKLQTVDSVALLHSVLHQLASDEKNRWTRTQILHYLPSGMHRAAGQFFDGERLRLPEEQPSLPRPVDLVDLDTVLRRIHDREPLPEGRQPHSPEPAEGLTERTLSAKEIASLPPYDGPGASHAAVRGMIQALREEIAAVDARSHKRFRLRDGRCVDGSEGRFTYQFTWSSEPEPHVPGTLRVAGKQYSARVGEQIADAEKRYTVVSEAYLGATIASADFFVDPTFLITLVHRELIKQLEADQVGATSHIDRLLQSPGEMTHSGVSHGALASLNAEQQRAVNGAAATERAYVWGPPGTGKTTTLGALVATLAAAGKRVLVVSPYNVAVDAAALSCVSRGLPSAQILRIGRVSEEIRRKELDVDSRLEARAETSGLLEDARQLLAALCARQGDNTPPPASVRACLDELGAFVVKSKAAASDSHVLRVAGAITTLRRRYREPEGQLLSEGRVVASTMALHLVLGSLRSQRFDHVIVDEASVVRPPEAVLLSMLTDAPITFFGDPKQLPPIVVATSEVAKQWLGRNPFALAGITRPADATGACVLLEEQHRMAPPISRLVSGLFYDDRLRNGQNAPAIGQVVLVDTSKTPARATTKTIKLSTSKENQLHRAIVADVIRAILRADSEASVLVVSPFVAQTRAYRREPITSRLARGIRFETIHASQGSEREVVVIDLVLAGSLAGGGRSHMFDEQRNAHVANLLNVAMSRAKRRLVVVGHRELLQSAYRGGLVDHLIKQIASSCEVITVPADLRCRSLLETALIPFT